MVRFVRNLIIYVPAVYTVLNLARQLRPDMEAQNYLPVIYALAWAVVLLTIERIHSPHIVATGVNPELEPRFDIGKDGHVYWVARYFLTLRNKGTLLPASDTEVVHVRLSYFSRNFTPLDGLGHEKPFWFDGPPATRELPKGPPVTIFANESPQHLCVAAQNIGHEKLYTFSYDSYERRNKKFHPFRPQFQIPDSEFYVEVRITAGNTNPPPIWVKVTEQGAEEHPKFEVLNWAQANRAKLITRFRRK